MNIACPLASPASDSPFPPLRDESDIIRMIEASPWMMQVLGTVQSLGLPDCWVAAGFVRNMVWDALHGFQRPTPLNDIDVLYFDRTRLDSGAEQFFEATLRASQPGMPWSVKNQARMHMRNGDAAYADTLDAMRHWAETCTGVAVRLDASRRVKLISAFGVEDLLAMRVRPTPHFAVSKPNGFARRMAEKQWRTLWPRLTIEA